MKIISYLYRSLISIILAAVLTLSSGLIYVQAYTIDGLDEFVALDMVGSMTGGNSEAAGNASESAPAGDSDSKPLLEAGPGTFAEAMAQEYRPQRGTCIISEDSRFFIVTDDRKAPSAELAETVRTMDAQFAAMGLPSSEPLPIVYGSASLADKGDIVVNFVDEDEYLHGVRTADLNQTYRLDIKDTASIEAVSTDGIWYGLLTLMEMMQEKRPSESSGDDSGASAEPADTTGGDAVSAEEGEDLKKAVILDCCRIKDGPDLKERALMLDCGRKYYSKDWIENFIKRASLQRYNAVVLHFAEAEGIRFDSEVFPWITDDIDSLTTDEMKEIIETAKMYHVDIIPSFDTPGHNTFMVKRYAAYAKKHPDFTFTYDGRTYDRSIKGFRSIANHYSYGGATAKADYIGIDLTKAHAVAFTNALIEGYADFFAKLGCTKFDIGSDELLGWYSFELGDKSFTYNNRWSALEHWKKYARNTLGIKNGSAADVLIDYINKLSVRLEAKGYTCRVFNDEIDLNKNQHVELRESVEVTYWFDADHDAGHYADKGHVMHNFMESWCFYVLRKQNGKDIMKGKYKTVTARNIFENWNPRSFARKAGKNMTVPADKFGGGYFAIWCDHPDYKNMAAVWKETELRTWANSSRMWNAEVNSAESGIRSAVSYADMKTFARSMNAFPGFSGDCEKGSVLPAAQELTDGTTWWQRVTAPLNLD